LPDKPSIAVLPFANISNDPTQSYFSDGLTNDLTTELSRLPGLFVIAPSSAFTYKGKAITVQEVGRELGVQYVLESSVRKAVGKVRITAQLAEATSGSDLWAERYDRPLGDIFSLQDEIVQRIVTTTKLQLLVMEHGIALDKRPDNVEAYDDYLQGMAYALSNPTKEKNEKARQLLLKAIALDPKFPNVYTAMAHTYLVDGLNGRTQNPYAWDRAVQLSQQALALDPSFAGGYSILSQIYLFRRQSEQSVAAAERALAIEPNSAIRYALLASALCFAGKPAEAIAMAEKARRLDPRIEAIAAFTPSSGALPAAGLGRFAGQQFSSCGS
jgi:adenylate cyclase